MSLVDCRVGRDESHALGKKAREILVSLLDDSTLLPVAPPFNNFVQTMLRHSQFIEVFEIGIEIHWKVVCFGL